MHQFDYGLSGIKVQKRQDNGVNYTVLKYLESLERIWLLSLGYVYKISF